MNEELTFDYGHLQNGEVHCYYRDPATLSISRIHVSKMQGGNERIVKRTTLGSRLVTTAFLAIDHNQGDSDKPVLWETMVARSTLFGITWHKIQLRYTSEDAAREEHDDLVNWMMSGNCPDSYIQPARS